MLLGMSRQISDFQKKKAKQMLLWEMNQNQSLISTKQKNIIQSILSSPDSQIQFAWQSVCRLPQRKPRTCTTAPIQAG